MTRMIDHKDQRPISSTPIGRLGSPKCVLVVDDNVDVAETLAELVGLLGHAVHQAHDGATAIATALAVEPDVVFLDIGLPDMTGHEVARELRLNAGDRPITIIAVTGWGSPEDRARSAAAGIDHHVVKPISSSTLIALLDHGIETRPTHD